ncbi:hypothetical protein [uncultured Maribacter sp.]|uniref:DUF4870 domain-containing protein n=1 Tax=uncultured Maribacter sp. TaxID=431308 RepID=UPI0030ED1281|tara:strand:- start:112272 stop:112616 length:345 start_codon:yes stop_codon:yes gene_type:complete
METTENNIAIASEGKKIATIAYITFIGLIIAFVMNKDKEDSFATYHIKQSLGLAITGLALLVIGMIPFLGWIINILGIFVLLYMWVIGFMNAINEKESPVPFLGEKYKEWVKNM